MSPCRSRWRHEESSRAGRAGGLQGGAESGTGGVGRMIRCRAPRVSRFSSCSRELRPPRPPAAPRRCHRSPLAEQRPVPPRPLSSRRPPRWCSTGRSDPRGCPNPPPGPARARCWTTPDCEPFCPKPAGSHGTQSGEITVFGVGRASTVQVPEASCDIGVELPDKDFDPAGGYNEYALSCVAALVSASIGSAEEPGHRSRFTDHGGARYT
jgi:hypothetical protein